MNTRRAEMIGGGDAARSAFFALTLWMVGCYAVISCFLWAWPAFRLGSAFVMVVFFFDRAWWVVAIIGGLTLGALASWVCFFRRVGCAPVRLWGMAGLYLVGSGVGIWAGGVAGLLAAFFIFAVWVMPLCLWTRGRWPLWLGHGLAWSGGVLAMLTAGNAGWRSLRYYFGAGGGLSNGLREIKPVNCFEGIAQFLHLSGNGWGWFFAAGLLLLLTGYLLTAKLFAAAAGLPYRRMFGTGVRVLWGVAAAVYLVFLLMAGGAERQRVRNVAMLERRFGRAMTPEAIGERYFGGERPDGAFWAKIGQRSEEIELYNSDFRAFADLPERISPEALAAWRAYVNRRLPAITELEKGWTGKIPPQVRCFSGEPGAFWNIRLIELNWLRDFSRLELLRIRLALLDRDSETARALWRKMKPAHDSLLRDSFLISGLVWIACENLRLDGLQMLLAAGLVPEAELAGLDADLAATERQVSAMQESALYGEAVGVVEWKKLLDAGGNPLGQADGTALPLRALAIFLPQLQWYFATDLALLAAAFNVPDFTALVEWPDSPFLLNGAMRPALPSAGFKFLRFTARLRAMRGLLMAEQYKRRHGVYPDSLAGLPEDPFSGAPLRYRNGSGEFEVRIIDGAGSDGRWKSRTVVETLPSVQVWSCGLNRIDDGGISDGKSRDDVRAVLINP